MLDQLDPDPRPFLLTPAQHLAMVALTLELAGRAGAPTKERAEQMARNHRVIAAVIARRSTPSQA